MSKRWAPSVFNSRVSSTYLSYFCCCDSSCRLEDWPIPRPNRVPLLRNSWAKYPARSMFVGTGLGPSSLGNLVIVGFGEPWYLSLRLPPPLSGSGARREGGRIVLVLIFSSTLHKSPSWDETEQNEKWQRNLTEKMKDDRGIWLKKMKKIDERGWIVEWRKSELERREAMITR